MKDKSKKLLVLNTGEKSEATKPYAGQGDHPSYVQRYGGAPFNMSDYLLKSTWSRAFELKTDKDGTEYLFTKLPLATLYGITMYANGGDMNIPSVYDGLPIDWKTLIRDENGVLMINPDIEFGGGASSWGELEGKPDWITNTKPIYDYSEIKGTPDLSKYALSDDLKKYVSLDGDETINGLKNFTKGLQIDGLGITKSQEDVVYIDANLVVRGGITMFGTNSVDVPTIMDAIATDNVNLKVIDGVLTFVGSSGGGITEVHWGDVIDRPTLLSSFTDDVVSGNYLPLSGGTLNGDLLFENNNLNRIIMYRGGNYAAIGNNYNKLLLEFKYATYSTYHGMMIDEYGLNYTLRTDNGTIEKYKVWNEYNDGSGSGLDADLLDGYHLISNRYAPIGAIPLVQGDGGMEIGSYVDFHISNAKNVDYSTRLYIANHYSNQVEMPSSSGTLALTSSNVASATKLQTARTIWGKSFDGTDDIDGLLELNYSLSKEAIVINNNQYDVSYIQFRRNGMVKGNIGWSLGNGTHLYNATSGNTLELSEDGELRFGTSAAGNTVWHAGNSNKSTVDWSASSLIAYCGGTTRQFVVTKKDYTWSGAKDVYPLVLTSASNSNDVYTMIAMPHIPFLSKGSRGYNGSTFGSIIRFESAISNAKVWDIGCTGATTNDFYLDYNSTKVMSFGNNGVVGIYTPNEWLTQSMLVLGRKDTSLVGNYAQIGITNGNLHIDAYKGYGIYLNFYQNTTGVIIDKDCNLLVSGGITMYSDQRKKTILNHVELSLKQIADAPLIEHYYNSDSNKTTHVGSIAQYWASMNDWFCKLDGEGYYMMEIQNAALASAISIARELQRYESKTDKKIRLLKKRIGELEEEIEKLKMA